MNIDPMSLSQIFINIYYDHQVRREFISIIKQRFPEMDETVIEAIWLTIDFMDRQYGKK